MPLFKRPDDPGQGDPGAAGPPAPAEAPVSESYQADDPRWQQIKAVREGRVFVNPSGAYLWDRHSAEAALQVLWVAKLLHPAQFADLDVNQETKRFYARFFHHVLTDSELSSIMNATEP